MFAAPLTASSIYSALEDVGAFSSAGIFVGSPEVTEIATLLHQQMCWHWKAAACINGGDCHLQATKAVHFALVVLPCSAEGVPASVTVGESAAPSFASRQGDVVHITHAAEAADALRGSFAALIA